MKRNQTIVGMASILFWVSLVSPVAAVSVSEFTDLGTYQISTPDSSYINYDIPDTFGNTLIVHLTNGPGSLSDAPAIGEVKIKSGVDEIPLSAIAISTSSHSSESGGNAWFTSSDALTYHSGDYGIGNLVDNFPGSTNNNYTSEPDFQPFVFYAYIDTPATITEIIIGRGSNRTEISSLTFYLGWMTDLIDLSYQNGFSNEGLATGIPGIGSVTHSLGSGNGGIAVPEPCSLILLSLGGLVLRRRVK